MHQDTIWPTDKEALYRLMASQLESLVEGCPPVSALSNAAALLWDALADINWAGFYLIKGDTLHLGPFQGKTACTLIPVGRVFAEQPPQRIRSSWSKTFISFQGILPVTAHPTRKSYFR